MPSRVETNPVPPMDCGHDIWGYGRYSSSGNEEAVGGSFPGGGHNDHQYTIRWTDVSAEASTSLAPAKPNIVESNDQSEVSKFLPRQKLCSIIMALTAVKHSGPL